MSSNLYADKNSGGGAYKKVVDQIGRRKFNLDEYERKGAIADESEEAANKKNYAVVQVDPLKARKEALDIEANVGKFQVVSLSAAKSQQAGFYCEPCDYLCKDSGSYLKHVNGKRHQQTVGVDHRPERSTITDVRDKLDSLKRKAESGENKTVRREEAAARLADLDRAFNGPKKKKRKKKDKEQEEEEEQVKTETSSSSSSSSSTAAAAEEAEEDPEMAAMAAMGFDFSNFGGSKKQ